MDVQNYLPAVLRLLAPETPLESQLIRHPTILEGLVWGEPRYGHPEGKVYLHIREIYDNIDSLDVSASERESLRLIALTHDAFKYKEDKSEPRDWNLHHAMYARRFMEQYTDDKVVLDIIELHDEAYYCWRMFRIEATPEAAAERFSHFLYRIDHCLRLYYLFFVADTRTGDKVQAPVKWFESMVPAVKF